MVKKKLIFTLVAFAFVLAISVGGTLAYITSIAGPVQTTFTIGDITLKLEETTGSKYQLIPGSTIQKDPTVTVGKGSEDCYLFIEVTKTGNPDLYLSYSIADGWLPLYGHEGIYYRVLSDIKSDVVIPILTDNVMTVKDSLTKEAMNQITQNPKLTFRSFAVQSHSIDAPGAAYHIAIEGEE